MSWLYLERLDCSWIFSYLPWWLYLCEVQQWVAVLRCCFLGREAIWKRGMRRNVSKLSLRSPFFTDHLIIGAIIKPNHLISPSVSSFIISSVTQCIQLQEFYWKKKKRENDDLKGVVSFCWLFSPLILLNWCTYLILMTNYHHFL